MTLSIYARPEFSEKTVAEINRFMRGFYRRHRLVSLLSLIVQAVVSSGLISLYFMTCSQPDIFSAVLLAAASAALGAWCGWMILVNVVYPPLLAKELRA